MLLLCNLSGNKRAKLIFKAFLEGSEKTQKIWKLSFSNHSCTILKAWVHTVHHLDNNRGLDASMHLSTPSLKDTFYYIKRALLKKKSSLLHSKLLHFHSLYDIESASCWHYKRGMTLLYTGDSTALLCLTIHSFYIVTVITLLRDNCKSHFKSIY